MPSKPLRRCNHYGCRNLAAGRFCAAHAAERRGVDHRGSARERGYGRAWDKHAAAYRALHPLCEVCLAEGRGTPTAIIHHLLAVAAGNEVLCDPEELLAVCRSCHERVERLGLNWRQALDEK